MPARCPRCSGWRFRARWPRRSRSWPWLARTWPTAASWPPSAASSGADWWEPALPSQAVVTILDVSSVKVKVSVPEAEIASITDRTPSTIAVEAAGVTTTGGRIEKGIVADALTHTYDVRIHVPNPGRRLLPGMVASVSFAASPSQSASLPLLPVTAVQKRADGSLFVWTVGSDSTAHRMAVAIGQAQGNSVAVVSGVEQGQRVFTEGYQ